MKKIEMLIKPPTLDEARELFTSLGVKRISVSELKTFDGSARYQSATYRGVDYAVDWAPKLKIEAVIADENVDFVVDTLRKALRLQRTLEDPVLVLDVDDAIRMRTSERNAGARR